MFETGQVFQTIRRATASVGVAACLGFATAVPGQLRGAHPGWQGRVAGYDVRQGPTSGQQLGVDPINGQSVPFLNKQPVQGFSAIRDNGDGTFWVMRTTVYGAIENSADFNLEFTKSALNSKPRKAVAAGSISKAHRTS